jgi:hypothetical protein
LAKQAHLLPNRVCPCHQLTVLTTTAPSSVLQRHTQFEQRQKHQLGSFLSSPAFVDFLLFDLNDKGDPSGMSGSPQAICRYSQKRSVLFMQVCFFGEENSSYTECSRENMSTQQTPSPVSAY